MRSPGLHHGLVAVLFLALTFVRPGAAQPTDALPRELQAIVAASGLASRVGIHVVDAATGQEIFRHRSDQPMNPASNQKLVTAAAALRYLGPELTIATAILGRVEAGRVAHLVLRGRGDPSLRASDLAELVDRLVDQGVRAVDQIFVDGSYFDGELLPPAFDQQPNEVAAFRAAVGAITVEKSSYELRVLPGATSGAPAFVRLAGEGYFELDNQITTSEAGAPNIIATQRATRDRRMELHLRGTIPLGIRGVGYRRRIEDPVAHAGHLLADALERAGIGGARRVTIASGPSDVALLASHESAPLSALLYDVGKHSDNFVAEMILKVLGAERRGTPGTSAHGAEVAQELLAEVGVPAGQATILNGSGLFEGNRIAPSHFTRVLAAMFRDASIRDEYLAHLAVGGVDGTLARRLGDLPAPRIVRAKTGTLASVIALSGYVLGPTPGQAYAFSVLANDVGGQHGQARNLADDLVRKLAASLYASR
jgi:D-alanyl-D-alanine carboxypeptidase/D-alanyl-D-alanine-endopeptidase (penicillin-binding protein 4)